jgi:hypothetical protein
MQQPIVLKVTRGETFEREFRFPGDSVTGATAEFRSPSGIPYQEFTVTALEPDTFVLSAASSASFLPGSHDCQLAVTWPEDEVEIISFVIVVLQGVEPPPVSLIVDGGAPDTEFAEETDGGEE